MSTFKKALVTGGGGFVGRHMIDALLKRGVKTRVIDNFSCSSRASFKPYLKKVELVDGDIRDKKAVQRAVKGIDVVYHFAAIRSVVKSVEDPMLSHEVNATGALLLLNAAAQARVKHLVFTSTSAVYGAAISHKQREDGLKKPMSPYGIAKLATEYYASYATEALGLPTTSCRIFNVYGPRQNPESKYSLVVPGVMSKIVKGERPVIDGKGDQARDFVYIGDVISAFLKMTGDRRAFGKIYNLGSGRATSINKLVNTLLKLSGSPLKPLHGPRRPGDPDFTCADVSAIRRDIGWRPTVSLEQGLKQAVLWYQKEN